MKKRVTQSIPPHKKKSTFELPSIGERKNSQYYPYRNTLKNRNDPSFLHQVQNEMFKKP
jgi:hypothetical protein